MTRAALALVAILASAPAAADSPEVCRPYAAHASQLVMNYVWERFYSHCLVQEDREDQVPLPPENPLDALRTAIPGPTIVPDTPKATPAVKAAAPSPSDPRGFCARLHRHVVWQPGGHAWNCR